MYSPYTSCKNPCDPCAKKQRNWAQRLLRLLLIGLLLGGWIAAAVGYIWEGVRDWEMDSTRSAYLTILVAAWAVSMVFLCLHCVCFNRYCIFIFWDLVFALAVVGVSVAIAVMEARSRTNSFPDYRTGAFAAAAALGFAAFLIYLILIIMNLINWCKARKNKKNMCCQNQSQPQNPCGGGGGFQAYPAQNQCFPGGFNNYY